MTRAPILVALALTVLLGATSARAEQAVQCELMSIRASTTGSTIGAALSAFQSQLMRAPFNGFTAFELLNTQNLRLNPSTPQTFQLPDGISGELHLQTVRNQRPRLRMVLRRGNQTLLNTRVAITPGHPFFVAGPSIAGGQATLILGIRCQ